MSGNNFNINKIIQGLAIIIVLAIELQIFFGFGLFLLGKNDYIGYIISFSSFFLFFLIYVILKNIE